MELNYGEYLNDVLARLNKAETVVLATSVDGRVFTRLMAPLMDGENILISTGGKSDKVRQMRANPQVAVAFEELSIEGVAEVYGHPSAYPDFQALYAARYPEYAAPYKNNPDDVLVIVRPRLISRYCYDGQPCKDILDPVEKRAYRVVL